MGVSTRPADGTVVACVAVVAPCVVALVLAAYVVSGWALGAEPFWPVTDLNVAEAALVRDHAEAMRLIHAGQNPDQTWPIRADLRGANDPPAMTPVQAAIRIRRLALVQMLLREGAHVAPEDIDGLVALADRSSAPDIAEYLRAQDR